MFGGIETYPDLIEFKYDKNNDIIYDLYFDESFGEMKDQIHELEGEMKQFHDKAYPKNLGEALQILGWTPPIYALAAYWKENKKFNV